MRNLIVSFFVATTVSFAAPAIQLLADDVAAPALVKQVRQHDVTWTFGEPVRAGQFVNGDWWIAPSDGKDSVTVVSVDPAPQRTTDNKLMNGSMVNPMPGGHGFDERASQWKADVTVNYPLDLKVNQSLVSAVCHKEGDDKTRWGSHPLKYIAVLTCLPAPAAASDFRPPYVGVDKPLYSSLKLRRDLLPSLKPVENTPNLADLANARFSRPWIEFPIGWSGGAIRGQYESGYGREKAVDVGGAGLLLCLDPQVVGDKEPLLIGLVQTGIDLYHTLESGGRWPCDGGHAMGRKFPILFAGLMLDNKEMLGIGVKYSPADNRFQEDVMAFIVTEEDVGRKLRVTISGPVQSVTANTVGVIGGSAGEHGLPGYTRLMGNHIKITAGPGEGQVRYISNDDAGWKRTGDIAAVVTCTVEPAWETMPVVGESKYQVLGYQQQHIGNAEWGGGHAINPSGDNPSYFQQYRHLNKYAWPGQVLATQLLGLKKAWNHDAVFLLMDQWMSETAPGGRYHKEFGNGRTWSSSSAEPRYQVSGAFISRMWDTYRATVSEAGNAKD